MKSLNGEVGIQVRFWIATTVETFRHQKKRYEFIISPYFVVWDSGFGLQFTDMIINPTYDQFKNDQKVGHETFLGLHY